MRFCKLAILALLMVLMPLRGMAGAMPLPSAQPQDGAAHQMMAGHDMPCCDHEEGGQNQGASCEQHDCCAAFLAPSLNVAALAFAGASVAWTGERVFAGFVPEHLDPPPLAL